MTADLGFAELTAAAGVSSFEADGQRDQTDLLIRLNYSYEDFPAFSAFTREQDNSDVTTGEVRLVSTYESDFSWIAGVFYNKFESDNRSEEFTPGYDAFLGGSRPDALEYLSVGQSTITESAVFGEVTYQATEKWDVTLGLRAYQYDVEATSAIDLPLYYSVFEGRGPDSIVLDYESEGTDDSGTLMKFNTSYKFTPDLMAYFTVSEGFRIGGANGVAACPDNIDTIESQIVCALSNEQVYVADTTTNYEFGVKSSFLRNRLYVNAAFFDIDWQDAQVAGATVNGAQPITANARGAGSDGFELSVRGVLSDELTAYATYSNVNASLTEDAPYLFGVNAEQGTDIQDYYDGKSGDRLSGAPETQVSVGFKYSTEVLDGKALDVVYGLTAQSDVLTKVGGRADGEFLPGFALSNISATIADDSWSVALYVDNLFNKYAYTSVRRDRADLGLGRFDSLEPNRVDILRNYGRYVVEPRKIGVKFTYTFDM